MSTFEQVRPDFPYLATTLPGPKAQAIIDRDRAVLSPSYWKPGSHASTFGGNPVCVASALATIELLEQELIDNAAKIGAHMKGRLDELPKRFPIVGDVRGLGLMIGIEMVRDQATNKRAPELRDVLVEMCFERCVLVLGAGPNMLRICPPLVITKDQADFAVDTIEQCLREMIK
jgi:4-aminobutyrate aminotransferase